MDSLVKRTLGELEQLDTRTDLKEPLYRISADNGLFLNTLIRLSGAKRVLEIGSSSGYSGLYMAEALREQGGLLTTCELSPFKIQLARSFYDKGGIGNLVTIIEGDARETLKSLTGPWDLVFIDAWKEDYPHYLESVWPQVVPGGVVIADDIISQADNPGIQAYLRLARSLSDAQTVTVPIDDGVEVTYKRSVLR